MTFRKITFKKTLFYGNDKITKSGAMDYAIQQRAENEKIIHIEHPKKYGKLWASTTEENILKLCKKNIHLYEVLATYPKKVYFDIDGNPETTKLEEIKELIKKYFIDCSFSISGYESEKRFSYHIILNNYLIFNDDDLQRLKDIVKYLFSLNSNFDWKVYTKNRNMKAINQSKPKKDIQKIILDENEKNHFICSFIPTNYYTLDKVKLNLKEQVIIKENKKINIDWSKLPTLNLKLPENINLSNPIELLKITPLNKDFDHPYTHKVARFCFYNGLTFEDFLSWYKNKSTEEKDFNKWRFHWENLDKFPPVSVAQFNILLKNFYPDLGNKNTIDFFNNWELPEQKIKKIKTITQEDFKAQEKTIIFNVGMGGGKTHNTIEYLKNVDSFCWITPNIALADNTYHRIKEKKINCNIYNSAKNKIKKAELIENSQSLLICLNSLIYIKKNYDVIVIDEIETFLKLFFNNDTLDGILSEIWEIFINLLKKSKKIILLDAFISKMTTEFLKSLNIDFIIYQREKEECPRSAEIINSFKSWLKFIIKDIKENKKLLIFYPYKNERKRLNLPSMAQLKDYIAIKTDKKGIYHNADASDKNNKKLKDVNKNWVEYDFVISNNKINVGLNFDLNYFDSVYLSIASFNSPRDIIQFSYRARTLKNNKIRFCYLEKYNKFECFEKEKVETNNDIFKNLFKFVSSEKLAPLKDTFEFFLTKAGYNTIENELIYDKLNEEIKFIENDFYDYDNIDNYDGCVIKDIEKLLYLKKLNVKDKLALKKFYFKKMFKPSTDDEDLKSLWNDNKFNLINNIKNVLYKDEIIEKLKNNYKWELHLPKTFEKTFKFNSEDLEMIFNNYKFKDLHKKSKHHLILKTYLNTVYGANLIYTKKDKSKRGHNYIYKINESVKNTYLLLKKILKQPKSEFL